MPVPGRGALLWQRPTAVSNLTGGRATVTVAGDTYRLPYTGAALSGPTDEADWVNLVAAVDYVTNVYRLVEVGTAPYLDTCDTGSYVTDPGVSGSGFVQSDRVFAQFGPLCPEGLNVAQGDGGGPLARYRITVCSTGPDQLGGPGYNPQWQMAYKDTDGVIQLVSPDANGVTDRAPGSSYGNNDGTWHTLELLCGSANCDAWDDYRELPSGFYSTSDWADAARDGRAGITFLLLEGQSIACVEALYEGCTGWVLWAGRQGLLINS